MRRRIVVRCVAVGVLLACLAVGWRLANPHRVAHSPWEDVQQGVTTAKEVEARFGPPTESLPFVLAPVDAEGWGLPDRPDGHPLLHSIWRYDDTRFMALDIDEDGVVIRCDGPNSAPPRSALRHWWEDTAVPSLFGG